MQEPIFKEGAKKSESEESLVSNKMTSKEIVSKYNRKAVYFRRPASTRHDALLF